MDSTQYHQKQERKQPSFLTDALACSMFDARQSPCRSLMAFKRTCHRYQKCRCNSIYRQSIGRGSMFPENLFNKETRVSLISNHRLSVPLTPHILLVSPVLFKELRPPWYSVQLLLSHGRLPLFFFGVSTVLTAASKLYNASTASPALPCAWHGCRVLRGLQISQPLLNFSLLIFLKYVLLQGHVVQLRLLGRRSTAVVGGSSDGTQINSRVHPCLWQMRPRCTWRPTLM
ncbi:hypothetical protein CY34DRAFT_416610 [Suillus luteus UH-Slu-Lm8-n1]|uniref:Uncharacterized protein n=1 Tax=Suillus luteus UH-Slu-Lm8-n1 TaxID=930992 RepID=A0A0D0AIQ8_9AGAM|nr:hypothetical protein CY34DRAFT_416610 [Suillus luteus UH-Slu-Lm8-n1]